MAYENEMIAHNGGCHCGRVRFEVKAPRFLEISECNCSICKKSGILHYVVRQEHFNLIKGEEVLTKYTFGTGIAEHPFCSICRKVLLSPQGLSSRHKYQCQLY